MRRPAFATVLTLGLALALALPALTTPAAGAPTLGTLLASSVPGNAGFGVRVTTDGAPFEIEVTSLGPIASSQLSGGVFGLDAAGNTEWGFAFTGHLSPDRLVLAPVPGANLLPAPAGIDVDAWTEGEGDFLVIGLTLRHDAPPAGDHRYVVWVGGGSSTTFTVRGAPGASALAKTGPAYVLGDAEIADGSPNAQAQVTLIAGTPLGVKVMRDAVTTIRADHKLYGFWGVADFKFACQFQLGLCLWKSGLDRACADLTGLPCDGAVISAQTPEGSLLGEDLYAFTGTPAGAYAFRVDAKVDAYGPSLFHWQAQTWVNLGENYSYLTVADVSVP